MVEVCSRIVAAMAVAADRRALWALHAHYSREMKSLGMRGQSVESMSHLPSEADIRDFWNTHPCGAEMIPADFRADAEEFFRSYDAHRYRVEPHILECLDKIDWRGKEVLEIGLGQGADSEQLVRRGARWNGLDLTP